MTMKAGGIALLAAACLAIGGPPRALAADPELKLYVSTEHEVVNGIAIIASGPRKLTIVNVVGSIDPAKLAKVGSRLGLPALPM